MGMNVRKVIFFLVCLPFCFPLLAQHKHSKQPSVAKHSSSSSDPIDIVYTWVDSSDPLWQVQRAYYVKQEKGISHDANLSCRFRSRDELRFSLRSIRKFAPYVRKIFIVTNGQKPAWIKAHPQIQFISHAQIFRNMEHLPTFNSMAIESCLHRIPGLAEHYVYFNDDVFLGRPAHFHSFFSKEGKMRFYLTGRVISRKAPEENAIGYKIAIHNTDKLLAKEFSKKKRFHLGHTPDPARKSVVSSIAAKFRRIFSSVESHRFRGREDYALTNGLIPYTAFYMKNGVATDAPFEKIALTGNLQQDKKSLRRLIKQRPLFFCIEDCQTKENKVVDTLLQKALCTLFPSPAPWESSYTAPAHHGDYEDIPADTRE